MYQVSTTTMILLVTVVIISATSIYIWGRRNAPGGLVLFYMMVAIFIWSFAAAMESAATAPSTKLVWEKIQSIGASTSAPLLLLYTMIFTRRNRKMTGWRFASIWVIPLLVVLLTFTNELHGLIWTGATLESFRGYVYFVFSYGPFFWVFVTYSYLCLAMASILLVLEHRLTAHVYQSQISAVLISTFFPWVGSIIYLFNIGPLPGLDITPISFAFTGVTLTAALFYYRLLDLVPVARDMLVERMQDGMLVIDQQNRIVDINPAAMQLLNLHVIPIGRNLVEILRELPFLISALIQKSNAPMEVAILDDPPRFLDVRMTGILNRQGETAGYITILRDITTQKRVEIALEQKSLELEKQTMTDSMTGLFNRRYIDKFLEMEFRLAQRHNTNLSMAFFDVDNFKNINDQYGHSCGDIALKTIAEAMSLSIRTSDIAARIGGDEFLVIFPHTDLNGAVLVMERFASSLKNIVLDCGEIHFSISVGITSQLDGDTPNKALRRVDGLHYLAKERGKDRIVKDGE